MKKGFLDYLENLNQKNIKRIEEKEVVDNPKVLCMNVEIRTVYGAKKVIEKLQEWISRQDTKEESIILKENEKPLQKSIYKIPPKKVVKSPILEARSHAMDILDGLPDEPVITEEMAQTNNINITKQPLASQQNITSVAGHASALL